MEKIDVVCKTENGIIPCYQTEGSSGADLKAAIAADLIIPPLSRALIPTGLFLQIPVGYEAQVRPRSGLAIKSGLTVLNTPGTIDSDYRGEVKVIMINLGDTDVTIKPGDRIAQLVFMPVVRANFIVKDNVEETERGEGGFGSTGSS
jgi:dUTP pyrophosphatase